MFDAARIRGVIPAMLTPLTDDEKVDEAGLRRLVRFLLGRGVHGIFALGSSGEFTALLPEEREQVIRIVCDEVKERAPVLIGASDSGTKRVISQIRTAQAAGADVAVVLPPYYLGFTESEILWHYRLILDNTELPILLYNNPSSTRTHITLRMLATLQEYDRIIGMKDSSGDFAFFQQLLNAYRHHPRFRVIQGHEAYAGISFLLGAHAAHLGLANVSPELFVQQYEAAKSGRIEDVVRLQQQLDDLSTIWTIGGGSESSYFNAMKAALHALGVCGLGVSNPYRPFGETEREQVRQVLERHDLL